MATAPAKQSGTGTITVDKVTMAQPYLGVVPLVTGSSNMANAEAKATLTGTAATCVYMSGFIVSGAGAATPKAVIVAVDGLLGGPRSFTYAFADDPKKANQTLQFNFIPPLPAAAINTPIVITVPPGGTGNVQSMVFAYGFYTTPAPNPDI
jgi:hypothetical protein